MKVAREADAPAPERREFAERGPDRRKDGAKGTLVIIGGREDKEGERRILREVARRIGTGKLVIATVASRDPAGYFEGYRTAFEFESLGAIELEELKVASRSEASSEEKLRTLDDADGVFFSGGDQLRITSQIGDTPIAKRIRAIYESGGVVAGTSAGAAAMCELMLCEGPGRESHRIGSLRMARGLGLIYGVIIDQHFAERGRMGRLLGAVAQNPRELGIGIDENTAIVVEGGRSFFVMGRGAVYLVDGSELSHSNVAEGREDAILSAFDLRLHVLAEGDGFDLQEREPLPMRELQEQQEREAVEGAG